jgi:hypothetical protein
MPGISRTDKYNELSKEFHEFMKKYDPYFKSELIRINISSTFMVRCRCIKCGSVPAYYYLSHKPYLFVDVRQMVQTSNWLRQWVKRMSEDWYLDEQPRLFNNISEFSFSVDDKSYLPTHHHVKGLAQDKSNVIEFVGCRCTYTVWAFNQKSVKNRSEITNRKGKYAYHKRFEY